MASWTLYCQQLRWASSAISRQTSSSGWAEVKLPPFEEAIQSTANSFPALEGIADRLREWLKSPEVPRVLGSFVEGEIGRKDVPISELVSVFVEKTGFILHL
jgi:hypothetical protein